MGVGQEALDLFRKVAERLEIDGWRRRAYSEQPPEARFERFVCERVNDALLGSTSIRAEVQFFDVWIDERGVVQQALQRGTQQTG
jgi:hypothetical protein